MSLTESQSTKPGSKTYGVTYVFIAYIRDELCDLKIITVFRPD